MLEQELHGTEKEGELYHTIGKLMAKELPDANDCPSLIAIYGLRFLIDLMNSNGTITRDAKKYESMQERFANGHKSVLADSKPDLLKHIAEPQIYDGYIDCMAEEGFIDVRRNPETKTIRIKLTEKGGIEAGLFCLSYELEEAELNAYIPKYHIENIKEEGRIAGMNRFNFWNEKVDEGETLSQDIKNRIVLGTMLFDNHYSIMHDNSVGMVFKDEAALKYSQLSRQTINSKKPLKILTPNP